MSFESGLSFHPVIRRLDLGRVHLPAWHPRYSDKTAPIYAYLIEHPDGPVLFDCGCGGDSELINSLYQPQVTQLETALGAFNRSTQDVAAIVLSHLHFDHCGQLPAVAGRPTYVQKSEIVAAQASGYTVAKWASIPEPDLRAISGDEPLAPGLKIMFTPGHTPGHQSLIVTGGGQTTIVGGQCCYTHAGIENDQLEYDNLFGPDWETAARDTLARLRSLSADSLLLAHA